MHTGDADMAMPTRNANPVRGLPGGVISERIVARWTVALNSRWKLRTCAILRGHTWQISRHEAYFYPLLEGCLRVGMA